MKHPRGLIAAVLCIFSLTGTPPTDAQPITFLDDEFQVNTYTPDFQRLPDVARLEGGGFVVVWQSSYQDSDAYGIVAQRFDAAGVPQSGEILVNAQTTGDQSRPAVAALAGGGFVVVWDSLATPGDSDNRAVVARRFSASGSALAGDQQVNSYTTGAQLRPGVAALPGGGFVVVWDSAGSADGDSDQYSVQARRFDAAGSPLGAEMQVNTDTTGRQVTPAVASFSGGEFVVVWDSEAGADGDGRSIAGQLFDATGSPQGGELLLNSYGTGTQQLPAVTTAPGGDFLVVWQGPRPGGDGDEIVSRRFDGDGTPLGVELRTNSFTTGVQVSPRIAREDGGNFLVVWESSGSPGDDTSGTSVLGRLLSAGGNPLLDDFQVNTYTTQYQAGPTVSAGVDGGFTVAWSSFENIGRRLGAVEKGVEIDTRSVRARRLGLSAAALEAASAGAVEGETVEVPITLTAGSTALSSVAFSLDFDEACLDFDPTDGDLDGIPDAITFSVDPAFDLSAVYDAGDTDGELDLVVADVPPEAVLTDGEVVRIAFTATCLPPMEGFVVAPVRFAVVPAPSFGDALAESTPGRATDGEVAIYPGPRGDCNGDAFVDAADVSAVGLEIFDGDGSLWTDAPSGTFDGSPAGCDANGDTKVDAGDVSCTVSRLFGGDCGGAPAAARPRLEVPGLVLPLPDDTITYTVIFAGGGQPISSLAFGLTIDTDQLLFDPTDLDMDGLPDSVRFTGISASVRSVELVGSTLRVLLSDVDASPETLVDGPLLEIDFTVAPGVGLLSSALSFDESIPASFGDSTGRSVEGDADEIFFVLFADGFESGSVSAWSLSVP